MRFAQRHSLFLVSMALIASTLVAYEPVRHNDFVSFDDYKYITENPNVTNGITANSIVWAFTKIYSANWHPLTWLSHMLDCEIYGLNPLGHHLTNLLIHIANGILLFLLLSKMTGTIWPSAFVAAAFALHPVHVESVAWASERKDVLSMLFWLLTIFAYLYYIKRPNFKRYIPVLFAFAMGLMSKPMVVTLPFVLLLLDYWPLERIRGRRTEDGGQLKTTVGRLIAEKIPLFVLSAISCLITFIAQKSEGAVVTLERMLLDYRVANVFISYMKYIGKTIWPNRLAMIYPLRFKNLYDPTVIICAVLFILLTIFCIYTGRHRKYLAVGWLWFVGTLVPVIGLVQIASQAMADRYMYIPMTGLLIIVTWAVKDLVAGRPHLRIIITLLALAGLSALIMITRIQTRYWENSLALFGRTMAVTKNNPFAEANYGYVLYKAGQVNEGIAHLRRAVRRDTTSSAVLDTLGLVLMEQSKFNEAAACFNEVIRQRKNHKPAYFCLGLTLGKQGKYDEAIKYFKKVLEMDPEYPNARVKMGTVLLMAKRPDEAVVCLNEALKNSDDNMEVYVNLAIAYNQLGDFKQSMQNRNKAAELKSDDAEVLNNLAWLLATGGDTSVQDVNRAVIFAERACELTGYKEPGFLDTLSASYAAAGKFAEAKATAEKAIKNAKSASQEELAREIEGRLQLYEQGLRYIQK